MVNYFLSWLFFFFWSVSAIVETKLSPCCSSFPELGQAAILQRNKGSSKCTETRVYSIQMTTDSSYLLYKQMSIHAINPFVNCLAQATMKRFAWQLSNRLYRPSYSQMTLCTTRSSVWLAFVLTNVHLRRSRPSTHIVFR